MTPDGATSFLRELDARHVWHPFTPMSSYVEEDAPIIVGGDGFELIDSDGRRYLDGISSLWCNLHGHRVPEIDQAIRDQLDRIAHSTLLGLSSDVSIRLAKMLVDRTPRNLTRVFYSDSGATSVEVALKMAYQSARQRGDSNRRTFVRVGNAYHGDTLGTVSVGGIDLFHSVYGDLLFDVLQVPSPVALRVPAGFDRESYLEWCLREMERVVRAQHSQIAAFILEPLVQGAAGILVHPRGYLRRVREITAEYGIPLIADEVAVGFGRTGTMFACEQEQVEPDFLCLAKGITGGYLPLAATLTTDDVFDAFLGAPHEGKTFFHGHTYTGNALGCAAAIASLERFDRQNVLENAVSLANTLETGLQELGRHPHVGEIRRRGVMVGIELVADRETLSPFPPQLRMGHRVTLAARKRGLILRPLGDVVVLMPAPAMPAELLMRICGITREAIEEATRHPT